MNPELSKDKVAVPYTIFTGKIREGEPMWGGVGKGMVLVISTISSHSRYLSIGTSFSLCLSSLFWLNSVPINIWMMLKINQHH